MMRSNLIAGGLAAMLLTLGAAAPAIAQKADAAAEMASETVLHSGVWTKKFANSGGEWSIVARGGKRYVVLDDAFRTRRAPDLKIFL